MGGSSWRLPPAVFITRPPPPSSSSRLTSAGHCCCFLLSHQPTPHFLPFIVNTHISYGRSYKRQARPGLLLAPPSCCVHHSTTLTTAVSRPQVSSKSQVGSGVCDSDSAR